MRKITSVVAAAAALGGVIALWAAPGEGEARKAIIETARSYQGVPYVYGAESPKAFDCSGFVQYVYAHAADIEIPRNSTGQWAAGRPIEKSAAKPGDILVFDTAGGGGPSHVAIYLGKDSMIHAVSEGPKTGVIVSPVADPYFGPRLIGARYFIVSPVSAATASPAPVPQTVAPASAPEPVVSQVGVVLQAKPEVFLDKIPAAVGTSIAFIITNGTGKKGVFHVFFYKVDADFSKTKILRDDRREIPAGGSVDIAPYALAEPGVYRLNVKTAGNTQVMQRTWKVVAGVR